jgi:hypothetical protein
MLIIRVQGNLVWQCLQAATGDWIAVCDALNLTLQSDTFADLMEDINLTLNSMFKDLLTTNELDRFFREHGWQVRQTIPRDHTQIKFDMPFFTAMMGSRDAQANLHQ